MDILLKRTQKYRVFPTRSQTSNLENQLSMCRHLWNWSLAERMEFYEHSGGTLNYYHQALGLSILKQNRPWFKGVFSQTLQDVLKRLQKGYDTNFDTTGFRRVSEGAERPGFPKFKKRGDWSSLTFPQYRKPPAPELLVPKIGTLKLKLHRDLPDGAKIKTLTIEKDAGKWFACFSFEFRLEAEPKQDLLSAVGLDMGLIALVHTSDNQTVAAPKFLRKMARKMARLQRRLSKATRRTPKYLKLLRALQKCHYRIRCQREDFLHKAANALLARYDLIAIEDLRVGNMSRRPKPKPDEETGAYLPNGAAAKSGLNKSILDAGWGKFFQILRYKAEALCKIVVAVPPHYTSQKCSACGEIVKKSLSQRTHRCPCGFVADRVLDEALSIKRVGLESLVAGLAK